MIVGTLLISQFPSDKQPNRTVEVERRISEGIRVRGTPAARRVPKKGRREDTDASGKTGVGSVLDIPRQARRIHGSFWSEQGPSEGLGGLTNR